MIRPLHPSDAVSLQELLSEPALRSCGLFDPAADAATYEAYVEASPGDHHRLVYALNNQLLGLGLLERPAKARVAHLGIIRLFVPTNPGTDDVAAELLSALIDLADNWLDLKRLEADIPISAISLKNLLELAGFEVEGLMRQTYFENGVFQDEYAMARLRGFVDGHHTKRAPADISLRERTKSALSDLLIRPMEEQDIDDLYEVFRAPENCRTTMQLPSQELWLTRQRVLEPPVNMKRMVAVVGGRAIGMISLRPRDHSCRAHVAGIGMMVHPSFWGLGIGSRLMEETLRIADQQLGVTRVELEVHTDNSAGIRLYEKFGFIIEGTKHFANFGDGGWADTFFMARISG